MKDKKSITFIHIGKCAGSSVWHSICSRKFELARKIEYLHLARLYLHSDRKYIITLRNPIKRFISAYYWRYNKVVDTKEQQKRYAGEYEMLVKTKTVENFVKEIQKHGEGIFRGKEQSGNYIHQIHQDIYYYLSPLVNGEHSNKIMAVLTQENLKEDMQTLLDIDIQMHHNNNENKMYDKYLSTSSIKTLNEILAPDYYCIEKLYEWGKLTDKQYNLLIK